MAMLAWTASAGEEPEEALTRFRESLDGPNLLIRLRNALIGEGQPFESPYGTQKIIYADHVASGRALMQIEDFVARKVLPFYGNSHTEASYCGAYVTRMRNSARKVIAASLGANAEDHAVVFAGSGATAGLNRLVFLLGVPQALAAGRRVVVLVGPYEHHSNLLPWRESGADVVEIPEAEAGGPDMSALQAALVAAGPDALCIGAFSAASNVTGIVTDTVAVTRLLRSHGARSVWDYAAAGPYLSVEMSPEPGAEKDAVVISTHKFVGGPASSGILALRRDAVATDRPSWPGGGTVSFVSPWGQRYSGSIEDREEAGTPNVIGDIRAALAFIVKDAVGCTQIAERHGALMARAERVWADCPNIEILGRDALAARLPIFSFRVRDDAGRLIHHQLFTRLLSDRFGVQARGGCACAGPYAHRLLGIDQSHSDAILANLDLGQELEKPGWVRLNLSWLTSDDKADAIIGAVAQLSHDITTLSDDYLGDSRTARFRPAPRQQRAG